MAWNDPNLLKVLKEGGVAVMPTDTLYGIVGSALSLATVERVYKIRKRNPTKPFIILIADITELEKFSVNLSIRQKSVLREYWPAFPKTVEDKAGAVSIILDCPDETFAYLHRGIQTLAFRIPENNALKYLLSQTGPLVAPSANPEGLPPAQNISEAKKYFGGEVDLYIDGGEIKGTASKIIRLNEDGSLSVLRP